MRFRNASEEGLSEERCDPTMKRGTGSPLRDPHDLRDLLDGDPHVVAALQLDHYVLVVVVLVSRDQCALEAVAIEVDLNHVPDVRACLFEQLSGGAAVARELWHVATS